MNREFLQDKIFHPFCSTKKNGLGIGLFQCKEIVESLDGQIKVESQVGRGTTFIILLPVMQDSSIDVNKLRTKKLEMEAT